MKKLEVLVNPIEVPQLGVTEAPLPPDDTPEDSPIADEPNETAETVETKSPASGTPAGESTHHGGAAVAQLLNGITMKRLDDGRMVLEAEPQAATTFAAMLEGVAALLRQLPPPAR